MTTNVTNIGAGIAKAFQRIETDLLDAVIGLPPNLFYSTAIPACILVFRDQKTDDRKDNVLFVDGSARFVKGKNQNRMTDEDIKVLIEAYETGEDPDGEGGTNVRLVSFDEIKGNGFDLNIGRYIKVAAEETADLGTALVAYSDARQERLRAEAAMSKRLAAAGIDLSMFEVSGEGTAIKDNDRSTFKLFGDPDDPQGPGKVVT